MIYDNNITKQADQQAREEPKKILYYRVLLKEINVYTKEKNKKS